MTQPQTGKYMYILHDLVLSCLLLTFDWCTEILTFVLQYALVELFGLVGGASSNKGKLEYCHYGTWSSFCYSFDDEEATVACKQLGFSGSPSKDISV